MVKKLLIGSLLLASQAALSQTLSGPFVPLKMGAVPGQDVEVNSIHYPFSAGTATGATNRAIVWNDFAVANANFVNNPGGNSYSGDFVFRGRVAANRTPDAGALWTNPIGGLPNLLGPAPSEVRSTGRWGSAGYGPVGETIWWDNNFVPHILPIARDPRHVGHQGNFLITASMVGPNRVPSYFVNPLSPTEFYIGIHPVIAPMAAHGSRASFADTNLNNYVLSRTNAGFEERFIPINFPSTRLHDDAVILKEVGGENRRYLHNIETGFTYDLKTLPIPIGKSDPQVNEVANDGLFVYLGGSVSDNLTGDREGYVWRAPIQKMAGNPLYFTQYESPTYNAGNLDNQDGWQTSGGPGVWNVSNGQESSGGYSDNGIVADSSGGGGTYHAGNQTPFDPMNFANKAVFGQVMVYPESNRVLNPGYAGLTVWNAGNTIEGQVVINQLGRVELRDGAGVVVASLPAANDEWHCLEIEADFEIKVMHAYCDGRYIGRLPFLMNGVSDIKLTVSGDQLAIFDNYAMKVTSPINRFDLSLNRQLVPVARRPIEYFVELRSATGVVDTWTFSTTDSKIHLETDAPDGIYFLHVKGDHFLGKTTTVVIADGNVITVPILNGDADGNNTVDISDYFVLVAAIGAGPGDPNWDEKADMDVDDRIDLGDYFALVANFGDTGDL